MSDTPTGNGVTPTGASLVSMWTTNSIAMKLTATISAARLNDLGAVLLESIDWAPMMNSDLALAGRHHRRVTGSAWLLAARASVLATTDTWCVERPGTRDARRIMSVMSL